MSLELHQEEPLESHLPVVEVLTFKVPGQLFQDQLETGLGSGDKLRHIPACFRIKASWL